MLKIIAIDTFRRHTFRVFYSTCGGADIRPDSRQEAFIFRRYDELIDYGWARSDLWSIEDRVL